MTINRATRSTILTLTILASAVVVSCDAVGEGSGERRPENIILMIGDGMGLTHITAISVIDGDINMERLSTVGIQSTTPSDRLVSDSAATGTAMATGTKTTNYTVSLDPGGAVLETVLEIAEKKGMMTGLVTTSSITDATPAVFAAHVPDRRMNPEIAWQMAGSGVDVLMGGGFSWFLPRSEEGSGREDERDPLALLSERMTVCRPGEGMDQAAAGGPLALFTALEYPGKQPERELSLAELTGKALEILSGGDDGFFLMVEGAQIDWAAHGNDFDMMILELRDFDEAVGVALDFAAEDGETLVIVTGDHETGGLALHEGSALDRTISEVAWTSDSHTGTMIPLFADGPGEWMFGGVFENTLIGKNLIEIVSRIDK